MTRLRVEARIAAGRQARSIVVVGHVAWALRELVAAGPAGVSTFVSLAPRWSAYVFKLRTAGIAINTEHEAHGGQFRGRHARYRLACRVRIVGGQRDGGGDGRACR